jgi:hypothetical protein
MFMSSSLPRHRALWGAQIRVFFAEFQKNPPSLGVLAGGVADCLVAFWARMLA